MNDWIEGKAHVPEISDERLGELVQRFSPLVEKEGVLHKIVQPDLRRTAFTWSPELTEAVGFRSVREATSDHYCGYHAFFKPSIAEVLAQLPADLPADCNAFWIDLGEIAIYNDGSGHRAKITYGVIE